MGQKDLELTAPEREWFDVMDGKIYLDHLSPGGFLTSRQNISLTFNTDGVHVFKSSRDEIWPLLVMVNEIHPSVRYMQASCILGADHLIFDGGVSRFSLCSIFFLHLLVLLDIFLPFITLARYFFCGHIDLIISPSLSLGKLRRKPLFRPIKKIFQ